MDQEVVEPNRGDREAQRLQRHAVVAGRELELLHGDEVCRRLLHNLPETRVLMLTAAGGLADRVEGLNLGADDYLGKPFAFLELVARVRALARHGGVRSTLLVHDDLSLDTVAGVARRDGRAVALTQRERAVLEQLLRADGGLVTADELRERSWSEEVDPLTSAVRNTVMRLRQKLGEPAAIETRPGRGYRLR